MKHMIEFQNYPTEVYILIKEYRVSKLGHYNGSRIISS